MTARQLLPLYPANWRHRYAEEFIEVIGNSNLSAQQTIDIVAGAVDAWLSPSVRASVRGAAAGNSRGGATVIRELKLKCATPTLRYTKREALFYAGLLIVSTLLMVTAGGWARREGYHELSEFLMALAFPASCLVTMPLYMKGQSWRAQAVFILVPLMILIVLSYFAVKF